MTLQPKLTSLALVPIREVWSTEPHHFTPWLLANAGVLASALGLDDLELESAEHPVGTFSLDLIGRTTRQGEIVIVENQFGPTDHTHLGQILTYAGGTLPQYVVWIAESFRDEHRAALDWLNLRTDSDTRFFGIEMKVVTLVGAEHLSAPLFEVVVQPNEWGKVVRQASSEAGNAETYSQFWSQLLEQIRQRGWTTGTSSRTSFITMTARSPGASYCLQFVRTGALSELRLEHKDAEINTQRFEALRMSKGAIETAFGGPLRFDPLDGYKACKIYAELPGVKVGETNRWPEISAWMIDTQARLRVAIEGVGGVPPLPASSNGAIPI